MHLVFADECLSHKTAVAAGALSQYLRFLVDPGPDHYKRSVSLSGPNYMLQAKNMDNNRKNHVIMHAQGPALKDDINNLRDLEKNNINIDDIIKGDDNVDEEGAGDARLLEGNEEEDDDYDGYINSDPQGNDIHLDVPHLNPKFRHNGAIPVALDDADRDEEYEQYIDDDEEDQDTAALKPLKALTIPHKDETFPVKHRENHDQDEYNYYYIEDDHKPNVKHPRPDHKEVDTFIPEHEDKQLGTLANVHSESSLGKVYLCVVVFMLVCLYLMYRFIKKRKVVIRYYHR